MRNAFEGIDETLDVEVGSRHYELNLKDVAEKMMIDPANLNGELESQAAFYYWISTLATESSLVAEDERHVFEIYFAEACKGVRLKYEAGDGKVPAQTGIEAEVKSTAEYKERLVRLLDIKRVAALLETVKDAVKSRQYTLIERSRRLSRDEAQERFLENMS